MLIHHDTGREKAEPCNRIPTELQMSRRERGVEERQCRREEEGEREKENIEEGN